MNLSFHIKQSSEYKPLEYLLTLPPMSKIKGISEDGGFGFEAVGKKGLYDFARLTSPFFPREKNNLTIKELIETLSIHDSKYKFEIEFEKEQSNIDIVNKAITLKRIYQRNKNSEILKELSELEKEIAKDAENSYKYALLNNESFPLGEKIISKDADLSYLYALNVLNEKRFRLAEPTIAKDSKCAYWYAKDIIKGRWKLGEPAIAKDSAYSREYCKEFSLERNQWIEIL